VGVASKFAGACVRSRQTRQSARVDLCCVEPVAVTLPLIDEPVIVCVEGILFKEPNELCHVRFTQRGKDMELKFFEFRYEALSKFLVKQVLDGGGIWLLHHDELGLLRHHHW